MQIFVQSFLNAAATLTIEVEPSDSVENLKAKIQDTDSIAPNLMKLFFNSILLEDGTVLSDYNIQAGSYIRTSNTISRLATKELKQKAKLDLAAAKRAANGNPRASYNITELPTQYSGNDLIDNPNLGGLIEGRPWATGTPDPDLTPYPQRTNYAFDFVTPPVSGALWNDDVNQVSIAINGTAVRANSYGRGIIFNGIDTHLIINNITDGISALTISMAADFQSAGGNWNPVYHGGSYGYNDIFAYIEGSNTNNIAVGTAETFDTTSPIVNTGLAWWDFVYSGTSVKVYKNGVEVTDGTLANANIGFTSPLLIGARYETSPDLNTGDFLNGTIYRIKGVMSALTPASVATQYNSIRGTYGLPVIPPTLYTDTARQWLGTYSGGSNSGFYVLQADYPNANLIPAGANVTVNGNAVTTGAAFTSTTYSGQPVWYVYFTGSPGNVSAGTTLTFTWTA
jgi:hypothetical protein